MDVRHGDCTVEPYDGRRPDLDQPVVQPQQRGPVRRLDTRRLGVDAGDRGLQCVPAGAAVAGERTLDGPARRLSAACHQPRVPRSLVLTIEQDCLCRTSRHGPRLGEQHEPEEAKHLRLLGEDLREAGRETPSRLLQGVGLRAARTLVRRGRHEMHDREHGVEPSREVLGGGDGVPDAGRCDLPPGTGEPRRCRRGLEQQEPRRRGRRESAHHAQREKHAVGLEERGMAAGEHEAEQVVVPAGDRRVGVPGLLAEDELGCVGTQRARAPVQVERMVAGGPDEPADRVRRHRRGPPGLEGALERTLGAVLGGVQVAGRTDGRRDHAAPVLAVHRRDEVTDRRRGVAALRRCHVPTSRIGRTSTTWLGACLASASAASSPSHSMT